VVNVFAMACLSSCLLPELVAAAAGGLREQDYRSAAGVLSSSSSSSETGLRAIRGQNKKNFQLKLSGSTWIRGDSFKNERLSCVVAAAPPPPGMMALSKKQLRNEVQMSAATSKTSKISTGSGGAVLEDVPHLTDWLPDIPVRFFTLPPYTSFLLSPRTRPLHEFCIPIVFLFVDRFSETLSGEGERRYRSLPLFQFNDPSDIISACLSLVDDHRSCVCIGLGVFFPCD
jgi:hypothetical protein